MFAWLTPATAEAVTVPESPAGGAPATVEPPKAFDPAFDTLRRQDLRAVGRDPVARELERLIERHRGHPRVAEAMLHVASLWECESAGPGGYVRDQPASLRWLRAAAEAAEPGSDVWNRAHFDLAGRLSWGNMAEARALVAKVAKQAEAAEDWVTLAEAESRLMWFCVTECKIDEAEAHAVRLLKWYDDPRRVPEGLAKTDVDMLIRGAAWGMVSAFEEAPWPWEQRVERFNQFNDGRASTFLQTIDPTQQERLDRLLGRKPPTPRMRKWTPDPAAPALEPAAVQAPAGQAAPTTRPAEAPRNGDVQTPVRVTPPARRPMEKFEAVWLAPQQLRATGPATRPVDGPAGAPGGRAAGNVGSVLFVTRGNVFFERAIKAIGWQKHATVTPEEFERQAPAGYDVIIFDNYRPVRAPVGGRYVYFGVVPGAGKLKAAEEGGKAVTLSEQQARTWKHDHPILRDLDLAKVYAETALKLDPAWEWEVLIEGTGGPLAVASRDGDGRGGAYVVVTFDPMQSNWPLMRSFPVFLARSVQWLRGDGDQKRVGEEKAAARLYFEKLKGESAARLP